MYNQCEQIQSHRLCHTKYQNENWAKATGNNNNNGSNNKNYLLIILLSGTNRAKQTYCFTDLNNMFFDWHPIVTKTATTANSSSKRNE